MKSNHNIGIAGYTTYQINSTDELNDGSAILIKANRKHELDSNYIADLLDIEIQTNLGPVNIATTYIAPRRPYIPYPDFHRLASRNNPTCLIANLNAPNNTLGNRYTRTNQVDRQLEN